jgi:hypothetical protein
MKLTIPQLKLLVRRSKGSLSKLDSKAYRALILIIEDFLETGKKP